MYIDTVKSDEDAPVERKSDRDSFFDDLDALLGIKPKTPKVEEVVQVNRSDLGKFIMFIGEFDDLVSGRVDVQSKHHCCGHCFDIAHQPLIDDNASKEERRNMPRHSHYINPNC